MKSPAPVRPTRFALPLTIAGPRPLPEYALVDANPADYAAAGAKSRTLTLSRPEYEVTESTDDDEYEYMSSAPRLPPPRRVTDGDHLVEGIFMILPEGRWPKGC